MVLYFCEEINDIDVDIRTHILNLLNCNADRILHLLGLGNLSSLEDLISS